METSFECVIVIIIVIVSVSVRDGNLHVRDGRCEHYTPVTVHVHAIFLRTFGPKHFDWCFANKEYTVGMQSMRLFGLRTDHAEDVHHADANRLEKKKHQLGPLAPQIIPSSTASLRLDGTLNGDLIELRMNLATYPRTHFMLLQLHADHSR